MTLRNPSSCSYVLIIIIHFLFLSGGKAQADSTPITKTGASPTGSSEKKHEGITGPITGMHVYWQKGLHLDSRKENFKIKIGGRAIIDGGDIDLDEELQGAFPGLGESDVYFRALRVDVRGRIKDVLDFRIEIDFANIQDIKDTWIRFPGNRYLKHLTFGHVKEPFSLEELMGLNKWTFMERALPVQAFSPGRNIGIRYDNATSDKRLSWAVGGFLNAGSIGRIGEAKDQITNANGYDITARITGLPLYEDGGRKLLHLGLGYSHGFRDENNEDGTLRFRTRPETRITDVRLVDTFDILSDGTDLINPEVAFVYGPFSFQGEYFYAFTDAETVGNPNFWGFYAYLSYNLMGHSRGYDMSNGLFSGIAPEPRFHLRDRERGSVELGFRYSYIDLNDEGVKGGKERNFTAGLNWYLNPNIRFMVNYIHANVKDRGNPRVEDRSADIFQTRFQVAF